MTVRAVILGVLGSAIIAAVTYVNDAPLQLNFLVGTQFPISVFGMLVIGMVVVNPLLFALRRGWRLSPREIAFAIALMLVACSVPGGGLFRTFPPAVAMPVYYNQTMVGWKKNKVLQYTPPAMLVNDGRYDPDVIGGFRTGMRGESNIPFSDVPWAEWQRSLVTWLPVVFLCSFAVICLSLIVHRQWSRHERLRYPIAEVAATLMQQDPNRRMGPIYRYRSFWLAAGAIVFLNAVNYLHAWYPERAIEIPLHLDLRPILHKYKTLARTPGAWRVLQPVIYPTAVAFAYFLASDVSFSMGIAQIVFMAIAATLVTAGVDISENRMDGGVFAWQRSGSYLALALLLVYVGRSYYGRTLKRALTFRPAQGTESYAVWACRGLIVCLAGMVALLTAWGLDWPFSVMLTVILLMMFLVIARIVAESGLILCQALWTPAAVFIGLFGYEALGPKAIVIIGMVCCVLVIDPRECLMPFMVNGLRICDRYRIRPSRLGLGSIGIYVMAVAIALPVVLWTNYNYGRPQWDYFSTWMVPKFTFNAADRAVTRLRLRGQLAEAEDYTPLERIAHARPQRKYLWSAGAGFAAVFLVSVMRLRFAWWPIHPILFLVWASWGVQVLCHSFLVGWLIKLLVTRLGGAQTYRNLKPVMVGVIAGDLISGLSFMAIGASYYGLTGLIPKLFRILPG